AVTPKKARKFKKHAFLSKKKTFVAVKDPAKKPARKLVDRRQSAGVQIKDTHGVFVSKKKAPTKAERSKGIKLLSEAALLEEAHNNDDDDDDDQQGEDERTKSKNDKIANLNKTDDDDEEDEFVHTSDDYVPTDDENLEGEWKDDEEMTDAGHVDAEHENVNQEVAGDQVKDDDLATVTVAPATQKTKVPLPSSSISSDHTTKFLNFDNIPSADTKIISMMDIKVQHEDPSILTSPLLTVPVSSKVPTIVKEYLGTSLDDTLHKVIQIHTTKLIKEYSVLADVIEVPQHQQKPQKSAANIHKIKMEQAGKQQKTKYTITSSDTAKLQEFNKKRTLFEIMTKIKSFNKNTKHKALYHALIESILKDEDAMDKSVADRLNKRKPDDANKDEGPPAGSNQGLKRKKASRDAEPSKKAKSTETSKGTTKSQRKSTGKSAQVEETVFKVGDTQVPQNLGEDMGNTNEPPVVKVDPKDWFKKPKRPHTPDPEWNECKTVDSKPT
ncbi:hypothetical protein Tco_1451921, partial [Tanacetum coccineum]